MFKDVPSQFDFPAEEKRILAFWQENRIYEKSLEQRAGAKPFIFYEGPPTANGMPHPGHCLTRAIKDLFPRYRTMRGYLCERKAGWDTHGLPVEYEIDKENNIKVCLPSSNSLRLALQISLLLFWFLFFMYIKMSAML